MNSKDDKQYINVLEQNESPQEIEKTEFVALLARIVKQVSERLQQDDDLEKSA